MAISRRTDFTMYSSNTFKVMWKFLQWVHKIFSHKSLTVKELWKSVNFWLSYDDKIVWTFFTTHSVFITVAKAVLFNYWFLATMYVKVTQSYAKYLCGTFAVPRPPIGRGGRPLRESLALTPRFSYALASTIGGQICIGSIWWGVWHWMPYVASVCCRRTLSAISTTWTTRSVGELYTTPANSNQQCRGKPVCLVRQTHQSNRLFSM